MVLYVLLAAALFVPYVRYEVKPALTNEPCIVCYALVALPYLHQPLRASNYCRSFGRVSDAMSNVHLRLPALALGDYYRPYLGHLKPAKL